LDAADGDEAEPVRARFRERVSSPCGEDGEVETAGHPLGVGGCAALFPSSRCIFLDRDLCRVETHLFLGTLRTKMFSFKTLVFFPPSRPTLSNVVPSGAERRKHKWSWRDYSFPPKFHHMSPQSSSPAGLAPETRLAACPSHAIPLCTRPASA